jgi:hypothetical protein
MLDRADAMQAGRLRIFLAPVAVEAARLAHTAM